jgi:CRISPR locus-related DNA-binding protein
MTIKHVTHIVPVGHTKEKLVDSVIRNSIKQFPVHRVILLIGKDLNVSGEEAVYETAKETAKELKGFAEIEQKEVEKLDVIKGAMDVLEIIKEERANGYDVKINISGSLHTIGIACYIAALISNTQIYSALPEYKNKKVTGIKEILTIPFFPIKEINDEQIQILKVLEGRGVDSVDELISRLKPEFKKETKEYTNERARLSHHLKALGNYGFINSERSGKNIGLCLSKIGEIYAKGKEINDM